MLPPVSVRQFAKLDGCSHTLVQRAIREGKLPVSEDGKIDPALAGSGWRKENRRAKTDGNTGGNTGKVATKQPRRSAVATGTTKSASTHEGKDPLDASSMDPDDFISAVLTGQFHSLAQAEAVKENALAAKNLLAARREAGDVIDIATAEAVLFEQARAFRDAWQNWPSRVAPLIAAKLGVPADPVLEALNEHVHQQLQDLGEPEPDFADAEQG